MGNRKYLGLDVGVASCGWALIAQDDRDELPPDMIAWGSLIFQDIEEDPEGKKDSALKVRGEKRRARRTLRRRRCRKRALRRLFVEFGWLPADRKEQDAFLTQTRVAGRDVHPWALRAAAVEGPISLSEFAKAILHLASHRGFLSPRKQRLMGIEAVLALQAHVREDEEEAQDEIPKKKEEEDVGQLVRKTIALRDALEGRTVGQYAYECLRQGRAVRAKNPSDAQKKKGRNANEGLLPDRFVLEDEFHRIWDEQARHHPALRDPILRKGAHDLVIDQRPLRLYATSTNECCFIPGRRPAARAWTVAQEVRMLEDLNNQRVLVPEEGLRPLTRRERGALFAALRETDFLPWEDAKRVADLPDDARFEGEAGQKRRKGKANLDREGFRGNRTHASLAQAAPEAWSRADEEERERIVEVLLTSYEPKNAFKALAGKFSVPEVEAARLVTAQLEKGYRPCCQKALAKIRFAMLESEEPLTFDQAAAKAGLVRLAGEAVTPPTGLLPLDVNYRRKAGEGRVLHPLVRRAYRNAARVINAVAAAHGIPDGILVELPRDLTRSKLKKQQMTDEMSRRKKQRDDAADQVRRILGRPTGARVSGVEIEKYLLGEEMDWRCPYDPEHPADPAVVVRDWDIEHIVPMGDSLDDSWINKTVAPVALNRAKGKRTPHEWMVRDGENGGRERFRQMLTFLEKRRALIGKGVARKTFRRKLERIKAAERPTEFVGRDLAATGWAAREVLSALQRFGPKGLDVVVTTGEGTSIVRREFGLVNVFDEDPEANAKKRRDDHRHHAVDAYVTALTNRALLRRMQLAYRHRDEFAAGDARRPRLGLREKWPHLREELRFHMGLRADGPAPGSKPVPCVVVHVPNRRIAGKLHDEKPIARGPKWPAEVAVREAVKALVAARRAAGLSDRPPTAVRIGGELVRLDREGRAVAVYPLKDNHHVEIWERPDGGKRVRKAVAVSTHEARERVLFGHPLFRREDPDWTLVTHLCRGDLVEWAEKDGTLSIRRWSSASVSGGLDLMLVTPEMARVPTKEDRAPYRFKGKDDLLRIRRRVVLDPLGRVVAAEPRNVP